MSARELITEHLDLWTGAVTKKSSSGRGSNGKVKLTGVKKLRELILDLALKGRLSERFIEDQPAEQLIEQFFLHKEKIVKDGELRRQKKLPEITDQEHEYKIPETWQVERLARLSHQITKGTTPTSIGLSFSEKGVNFVKVENLRDGCIDLNNAQFISEDTHQALQRSQLEAGDILFSIAGTIGKTAIVQHKDTPANTNQALAIIKGTAEVFTERFLKLQLDSFVSAKAKNKARGGAMNNISLGDLSNLVVLVPPREEQHRIVQKVDELMALCDRLEQQTNDQLEAQETLVDTLLGTLTESENATELADNWARLAAHFDTLITTEQCIDKLKQTILQLAVMGRLVEQSPFEGNSSVLLQEITDEKNRLVETGALKRKKNNFSRNECELFALPSTWSWVISNEICALITDGEHNTPERTSDATAVPLATAKNVRDGYIDLANTDFVPLGVAETCWKRCKPEVGDILMVSVGATLGRLAMMRDSQDMVLVRSVTLLRPMKVLGEYLAVYLRAPTTQSWIWRNVRQSAQPCLYLSKSSSIPIGLPPLAEQHRIVQKVDELMALCDKLKERLNQASETRCQLAEAVVEEALN